MLKLEQLKKTYLRGKEFNAIDGVNLTVNKGEFISIIGKSGSGKTTLLNLISGVLIPSSGKIFIEGKEVSRLSDTEKSFLRNDIIGFIPQTSVTLSALTVIENICLPFYLNKRNGNVMERAEYLLNKFGIEHLKNVYPKELSGGELRRAAIARALVNSPKIILADEPTSDLDIENTKEVLKILQAINKENNTTIILVTHELLALKYSKNVYTMIDGKLIEGNALTDTENIYT
ncbi:ABC transporter ATP-binding protein [Treponema pedis]|uniref:ABC transporter ATP-binding protein n=1 Tax=Treponema pedis TaxID=409322 RepID=A0A7S6WRS1_9SPIR|nr:ABC transporter ATP-binding protein [Treponema pedis]QSI04245.1 ABC transporter ATP-binding protein [Treponema pedis]